MAWGMGDIQCTVRGSYLHETCGKSVCEFAMQLTSGPHEFFFRYAMFVILLLQITLLIVVCADLVKEPNLERRNRKHGVAPESSSLANGHS